MEIDKIYFGDCLKVLPENVQTQSIGLIYADPPYNLSGNGLKWEGNKTGGDWYMVNEEWDKMSANDYIEFTRKWIRESWRVLRNNGSIYISCSFHNVGEIITTLKELNFKINNIITWYKTNAMPNMTRRVYTHATEYVVWAVKGPGWIFNYEVLKTINPDKQKDGRNKQMRDLWSIPLVQGKERLKREESKALHPTQKPEELLRRIILASSVESDIVLDPFLGSGTTAAVAKKNNRHYIGIESNNEYCVAAKNRIDQINVDNE